MFRVALLDDYQRVAMRLADWASLGPRTEVTAFSDHVEDRNELARRLRSFQCVMLMRERTRFPRDLFERLPDLRLLVTSGMWNVAVDLDAATDHGIQVCGTGDLSNATSELTLGLMLSLARHIHTEHQTVCAGHWQTTLGTQLWTSSTESRCPPTIPSAAWGTSWPRRTWASSPRRTIASSTEMPSRTSMNSLTVRSSGR